ncbi:hypothetical protein [Cytobacillus praedii]|uniref:hypothetical protein n=1 Tax=Cytobacillus praedii TaxID=1742358 RepID=UPI002E1F993E|nr:hypothetical protein [Cytobacillus praedii]
MKNKQVIFSEDGDIASIRKSNKNADEFIIAVNEQYHEEVCWVDCIRIEPCISTLEGIGADRISTDAVNENYFVAEVSEIGIGGAEKD